MTAKKARKLNVRLAKQVAPGVALAAAVVALTFTVRPGLKPDPRDKLAASMKIATVEPHVTFGAYLDRTHQHVDGLTADDRAVRGHVLSVQIEVQGRGHGSLILKQALYSARSGRLLPGQPATTDSRLRIETPD